MRSRCRWLALGLVVLPALLWCSPAMAQLRIEADAAAGLYRFMDGATPVLQYNHHHVQPPEGLLARLRPGDVQFADPRGNYVHPLYDAFGKPLTDDWSVDHPHHRGMYWAWPEVDWQNRRADLHAVRQVRAFPVGEPVTRRDGDVLELSAKSQWRWDDGTPIVNETATFRVHPANDHGRWIDFSFTFQAVEHDVQLARRGTNQYGGLNIRLDKLDQPQLITHTDAPGRLYRQSWGVWQGRSPRSQQAVGMAVLEHMGNPHYPNDWVTYPDLPWMQPTFPAANTRHTLTANETLQLRYRVWVYAGSKTQDEVAAAWRTYNQTDHADDAHVPLAPVFERLLHDEPAVSRRTQREIETLVNQAPVDEHALIEQQLLRIIQSPDASHDARWFACRQLYAIGSEASLPVLLPLLDDDALAHAARYALLPLQGETVDAALRQTLPNITDTNRRIGLINLIAQRGDLQAVAPLAALADAPGTPTPIIEAVIAALARIGGIEASQHLRQLQPPEPLQPLLIDAQLTTLNNLLQQGHRNEAQALGEHLLSLQHHGEHIPLATLQLLLQIDHEHYLNRLLSWFSHDDVTPSMQQAAAELLGRTPLEPPLVPRVIEALQQTPPQIPIITMTVAGETGNRAMLPLIRAMLNHDAQAVQLAAIDAMPQLATIAELPELMRLASESDPIGSAAYRAVVRMTAPDVDAHLLRELQNTSQLDKQLRLIRWLSDRQHQPAAAALLTLAEAEQRELRLAAWRGLESLAKQDHLPQLLERLVSARESEKPLAGRAIVAACQRADDPQEALQQVLAALGQADAATQVTLLPVLAGMGGELALQAVVRATQHEHQPLREAAVRTLANWREPEALPAIIAAARTVDPIAWHVLLVRGAVRLLPRIDPPQRDQTLRELAATLRRDDERRLLLAALPQMPSSDALALAVNWQQRSAIAAEAELAITRMALPDDQGSGGMWSAAVARLLEQAKQQTRDDALRQRIADWIAQQPPEDRDNLALHAPVRTSVASQGHHTPDRAVNGVVNLNSYWSGENTPAWLEVDLGALFTIDRAHVIFYWDGSRFYQFTIDVSVDGRDWTTVADYSDSTAISTQQGFDCRFDAVEARYVRVNIIRNSANPGAHIVNLRIFEAADNQP